MQCSIVEFVIGAIVLLLVALWDVIHFADFIAFLLPNRPGVASGTSKALRVVLGVVGTLVLIEPMIAGDALVEIHAPRSSRTTLDNLSVRVSPTCPRNGREQWTYGTFDQTGVALVTRHLRPLETRLKIEVPDRSHVNPAIRRERWVSPLVKLGIMKLVVSLE